MKRTEWLQETLQAGMPAFFIHGIARMAAHAVTRGLKTGYKKFGRMR